MKKRILTGILLTLFCLSMAACSNNGNSETESNRGGTTENQSVEEQSNTPSVGLENTIEGETTAEVIEEIEIEPVYIVSSYDDYSEGLAWIKFGNDDEKYWGCIDKSGSVVFRIDADGVKSATPFANGYSYISREGLLEVIDSSGLTRHAYELTKERSVRAYGDGYVLFEEYHADFDSSGYTYTIYDGEGNSIYSFDLSDGSQISLANYCGKGVFGFQINPNYGKPTNFYSTSLGNWIDIRSSFSTPYYFENNALLSVSSHDARKEGYRDALHIVDLEGNEVIVPMPVEYTGILSQDDGIYISDGVCVLHEYNGKYLISYNISDGTFTPLTDYLDKVDWKSLPKPLIFGDNRLALRLKGSDGNGYIAVFNKYWDTILEPVKGNTTGYSDSRMILYTDEGPIIYDENGEIVFHLANMGFSKIEKYSNGVARIPGEESPTYVDTGGNILFDSINFNLYS